MTISTITNHSKFYVLTLSISIAFITLKFAIDNTKYLFTTVNTEDMASEIF